MNDSWLRYRYETFLTTDMSCHKIDDYSQFHPLSGLEDIDECTQSLLIHVNLTQMHKHMHIQKKNLLGFFALTDIPQVLVL